jgi:UDP-3-O-acyl N-acetylglucosamine deacetylase
VRIPALVQNRREAARRTNLAVGRASVEMVEHVLAACAGLQVDNCEIWTDQPEMPGCDGSSLRFVEALLDAGIVDQDAARLERRVGGVVRVGDDNSWAEARPRRESGIRVDYVLDYGPTSAIGVQEMQLDLEPATFAAELASSRTFLLQEEAEWLRRQGLGLRVSYQDVLVFDNWGPLHNSLRSPDECVRHKVLDLVGDLALAGCDFTGHFVAYRSGHRLNAELVSRLLASEHAVVRRKTA